jgi:hypothetical protein
MRRNKAFKRGRVVPILFACGIGYLIGGWHSIAVRSTDLSAAETVALRFPQDWNNTSSATPASVISPISSANAASATSNVQFALLNPEPMVPQATAQATVQTAALEQVGVAPAPAEIAIEPAPPRAAVTPPASAAKAVAVAARRRANRPGFLLNDAQLASIKQRLNLTPDQEQMWPAVEAALRNIAYARAKEGSRQGGAGAQAAAVDPNSVEVRGLKSAAVPLIMSFSSEQKEEVRNLAHVMGLDQLATQF